MTPLARLLRDEIAAEGPIPFARYMAVALYHPTLGYYAGGGVGREPLGWSGDYLTSGDLHPLWGWCLARQCEQVWHLLGRPPRFTVVEAGAGRGLLARDVWRYALKQAPDWAATLRYVLADRAPATSPLRAAREQRLAGELAALGVPADAVSWAESLPTEGVEGCIVSNELLDALPVHRVRVRNGTLEELYVGLAPDGEGFVAVAGAPSSAEVAGYLEAQHVPWHTFPDGWQAEVCLEAPRWIRAAGAALTRGCLLTIDYGASARALYSPQRLDGTLAAYRAHRVGTDPLHAPGQYDLTAHVNFSAVVRAGHAAGLRLAGHTTQATFLRNLGIEEEARALARSRYPAAETDRASDRGQADLLRQRSLLNAVAVLLRPEGLGGFCVVAQQRGLPGARRQLLGFPGL